MKKHVEKQMNSLVRLIAGLGIILVAACGQATPPNPIQAGETGNVTITFANLQLDQGIAYSKIATAFHQQNPSITVTVIPQDHPVADNDIAKQADVVLLPGSNPATIPGFLALQPLLEAAPTADFNPNDLWPGSLTACSDAQGNMYGVPLTLFLGGVYYNPSLFDQAHVPYPQPGWTWDQFKEIISQLGSTTNNQTLYGFLDGPSGFLLDPLLSQQLSVNGGQVNAQAMAASLTWYVQLVQDKKLYPLQPAINGIYHLDKMTQLLNNHQAAMWLSTTDSSQRVYLPYPVDQPGDHTTPVYANCGAVSAGSKNPQAAWAWLDFLSHQDLSGDKASGLLPGRQSLVEASPYYSSLSDAERNALQYGLAHAWYYPVGLMTSLSTIDQAIANAIQSGTNLSDALQEATSSTLAQAQVTPTAGPVTINTPIGTPASLPENVTAISFVGGFFLPDPSKLGKAGDDTRKALVAEFEKLYPDIKVLYSADFNQPKYPASSPFPPAWDIIQTLSQDSDCFEFDSPLSGHLSFSDAETDLLDLSHFLDANPSMKEDFYPAFLKPFEMNGKLYGLPADVDLQFIAYNADLLTKLGIPFPQPGWTFDDLLSIASRATNLSSTPSIYGFGDNNSYIFHSLAVPYYDNSAQPPTANFTSDEVTKAFTWMQQLFQKGTVNIITSAGFQDYQNKILNGQVAMWATNSFLNYNSDTLQAEDHPIYESNFPFKVGYAPFPLLTSGASLDTHRGMVGYYISKHTTTAKAQACWDWIQFLSDRPSIFGGFSPRQSVLPKESVGQDPARFAVVQVAIQQFNPSSGYEDFADIRLAAYSNEMIEALASIFNGGDVKTALAKAQRVSDVYRACIAQNDLTGLPQYQIYNLVMGCYTSIRPIPTPPS